MSDKMVDVTYRVISNAVLENIKSRCRNIRDYNSIPAELRPGYQWDQGNARARYRWQINPSTAISQESDANLENSYNSFMTERGVNFDEKVTTNGLLNYFTALSIWCASHIVICGSQLRNDRLICFRGGATDLTIPSPIDKDFLIRATNVSSMIQIAIELTTNNIKNYFVRYNESLFNV